MNASLFSKESIESTPKSRLSELAIQANVERREVRYIAEIKAERSLRSLETMSGPVRDVEKLRGVVAESLGDITLGRAA